MASRIQDLVRDGGATADSDMASRTLSRETFREDAVTEGGACWPSQRGMGARRRGPFHGQRETCRALGEGRKRYTCESVQKHKLQHVHVYPCILGIFDLSACAFSAHRTGPSSSARMALSGVRRMPCGLGIGCPASGLVLLRSRRVQVQHFHPSLAP